MNPKVSIIILNWNGWSDTIECLESLYKNNYSNYETIIVDNDSKNDSIEKIKKYAKGKIEVESAFFDESTNNKPVQVSEYTLKESENAKSDEEMEKLPSDKKLTIIKNDKNDGFPGGCNIGMKYALNKGTDYILLLNNDTVVDPHFLSELVNVAETDTNSGIIGSKIYYYDRPTYLQAAGGRIRWWLGEIKTYGEEEDIGQYEEIIERDYVYGTSFLIRPEVINSISFMDTSFFFGVEEYDYCTKAKKAGFKNILVPSSKVWHKGGASSAKLSEHPETLNFIKKSGGTRYHKYYYRLFQRHGPRYIYFIPFSIFILRGILKPRVFFNLLFKGDFKTIGLGLKRFINDFLRHKN